MKKILIDKICLRYFKGVENKEIVLGDNINVIKGRNGIGKSTIADAISWVLFGTNQAGATKFGIKTKDKDGREIEDVAHSVEISLSVQDEQEGMMCYVLTRSLTETRKDDGSVTNNYTYKVDGEVETAGDFKKVVDAICPEEVFRLCSSPYSFTQMDWSEQRKRLNEMFGVPSVEDVTGGDKKYDAIKELLEKDDVDKILKHLNYKRKEVQKNLDEVPVRLEALKNVLPKAEDWAAVEKLILEKRKEITETRKNLNTIDNGGADFIRKYQNISTLNLDHKRKRIMEESAQRRLGEIIKANAEAKTACKKAVAEAEQTVEDLQVKIKSLDESIERCNARLNELETAKADGKEKWKLIKARTWEWNEDDAFCPTCKQALPEDQVQKIMEESKKAFLNNQASDLKKLGDDAARIKEEVKKCEENTEYFKTEQKTTQAQLGEAETALEEARKAQEEQAKKEEEKVSVETLLAEKPEYKQVCDRIKKIEAEQEKPADEGMSEEDKKLKADVEKKLKDLESEREVLASRLAVKAQWEKVNAQIVGLQEERTQWKEQIDSLDEKIKAASDFQKRSCEVLEENVNRRFKLVRWKMFRRQLDGTDKPWCECSVDGVPYSDLNTAAKINAGLDITNTLKRHYGVDVPCVIDNAETVQEPLYEGGQQIRLTVTDDEDIVIGYENRDEV
ncbi:AAA family ATPase [uncultured Prevotella sp.]|jgi:DNA repair exonuclease SbcCD ATPase subunit|uniref:AAA family ATPase n=1 Tax=uncultured Prevotella sp. TaxID=159272 RepID=UPI0025ECCEEA|nr:AAA family ATPase [uncultured Prevotella sp.]